MKDDDINIDLNRIDLKGFFGFRCPRCGGFFETLEGGYIEGKFYCMGCLCEIETTEETKGTKETS